MRQMITFKNMKATKKELEQLTKLFNKDSSVDSYLTIADMCRILGLLIVPVNVKKGIYKIVNK